MAKKIKLPVPVTGNVLKASPDAVIPTVMQLFRVRLPGCKPRVVDAEGRGRLQDYLDVEATSSGDAFEKFKEYNGILATAQAPVIELVGPVPAKEPQLAAAE